MRHAPLAPTGGRRSTDWLTSTVCGRAFSSASSDTAIATDTGAQTSCGDGSHRPPAQDLPPHSREPDRGRESELFHDTGEALDFSWRADRLLLEQSGFSVTKLRERPGLVEADVAGLGDHVRMEWACDSAFRFFPLRRHAELGLTLHPFDLATNKVLALVGRLEVRDWIDVITSDERIQPLGNLAWAACGKDPGFGPRAMLEHAARTGRYTAADVESAPAC